MTVLLVGRSRVAGDFAMACEYGGRDYARLTAPANRGLDLDQARELLVAQIDEHAVHAIVSAPVPFDEDILAEASHVVAAERGLPIVHATLDVRTESLDGPKWVWIDAVDQISDELGAHPVVVVDLSLSLAENLEELGSLPNAARWDVLTKARRTDRVGPSAMTVDRALRILRDVGAQAVVVADRGNARTRSLLAAADQLGLQVVALRARQPWRSPSPGGPTSEAHDVLEVANWLTRVEQAHATPPTSRTEATE